MGVVYELLQLTQDEDQKTMSRFLPTGIDMMPFIALFLNEKQERFQTLCNVRQIQNPTMFAM